MPGAAGNARRESARGHGITLLRTLVDDYAAPLLVTSVLLLLITLNGSQEIPDGEEMANGRLRYWAGWDDEWLVSSVREKSFQEIGGSVSGWWRIDQNRVARCGIEHVATVHRGVTRALFRIEPRSWKRRVDEPDESGTPVVRRAFRFQVLDRFRYGCPAAARRTGESPRLRAGDPRAAPPRGQPARAGTGHVR